MPVWTVGAILALLSPIQAQTDESHVPVSLQRVRTALRKPPPRLQMQEPSAEMPDFRVEVQQRPFVLQPAVEKPFDLTWGLPSAGELLMRGIEQIASATVGRGRAERRARKEVKEALAAFCAVHECSPTSIAK